MNIMRWLRSLAVVLLMAAALHWLQEYRFYAKEAEHLWLNDAYWIRQQLFVPGGFSQLLTSAMTQFFGLTGVGALAMAVLLWLVMRLGEAIQQAMRLGRWLTWWWLLPAGLLALCHENGYYSLRGTMSMMLAMLAAWGYVKRPNLLAAGLVGLVLYLLIGSTAVVALSVIVVYELLQGHGWWRMALAVLSLLIVAGCCVHYGPYMNMEEALTPAQYYEWPSTYFFPLYAWLSVPLLLLAGRLCQPGSVTWQRVLTVLGVIVPLVTTAQMYRAVHNASVYLLREDEWRTARQDWDGILAAHRGWQQPTPFISYLNLALAQKGQLVERMGEFRPYIVWSDSAQMYSPVLMTQNELSRDALKLQSAVCMAWGGAALCNAQKAAFEANFLTPGYTDPEELHRLALTNQVFATPATARKYLRRLSRTTMHHDWADQMLADTAALEREACRLREALPDSDAFYMKTQVGRMLRQIAMQTPDNRIATQFYEAYLVQTQDSVAYRHWKEYQYDQHITPTQR